jgi:hypothetical protein
MNDTPLATLFAQVVAPLLGYKVEDAFCMRSFVGWYYCEH